MSRHRRRTTWPRVVAVLALALAALAAGALIGFLTAPPAASSPTVPSSSAPACHERAWRSPVTGHTWWSCARPVVVLEPA